MNQSVKRMTLVFSILLIMLFPVTAHAARFRVTPKANAFSISVKWGKKKGAVKYALYRADVTKNYNSGWDTPLPAKSAYKKLKTLKGTTYTDQKVKKYHFYTYYVTAYNKKGKAIASTYSSDDITYMCKGFGEPGLINNGIGENHTNTTKRLYLYVEPSYGGLDTNGASVYIYRRKKGSKKYKKIGEFISEEGNHEYTDRTVKPGQTYYYKAQIVGTAEGRTLRSKKSKALKISACHFTAKYKVKCLTLAGTERSANKKEILLQLSNGNKYNGETVIKPAEGIYNCTTSKGEPHSYGFHFTKYSTDGKNWHPIPSKGVALPKKKALYLKGDILKGDQKEIVFCGTGGTSSLITSEEEEIFDYSGPGVGWTLTTLNLTKGTGKALEMADY